MTKGKSYNRIVFLTTLSVYLGLVLVGATPQALAFAATTRSFDIQNEVEVKDDLDKKPENEEIESFPNGDFPALFVELLNEIRENKINGKIPFPIPQEFSHTATFEQYEYKGYGSGFGSDYDQFDFHIENAIHNAFQPKAFEVSDFVKGYKNASISVEAKSGNWQFKISFSKLNAAQYADFLNREFASRTAKAKNDLTKQTYENTKASLENNQVFIVTRLPRAGIDSLLK